MSGPDGPIVVSSKEIFAGRVFRVLSEDVDLGSAGIHTREFVRHPGAVGVVALNDAGEVMLIRQYRHPVGDRMWEIPAGLKDVAGESDQAGAARELAEEGRVSAGRWTHLLSAHTTPGMSDERIDIFLAEEIESVGPEHAFEAHGEELDLEIRWTDFREALQYVDRGDITNGMAVMGLLALERELARRREAVTDEGRHPR